MALKKQVIADKIEVVETGEATVVQVRTATIIEEDGVELSRSYHRHVIAPRDDYSKEEAEVQAVCEAVFTAEVIEAYELSQSAQSEPTETQETEFDE